MEHTGGFSGRQAVLKAKDKVEKYRRNSLSSDVSQPPPYNPHYNQGAGAHRRSNTCPEFVYPQLDRSSLSWNAYPLVNESSATQPVNEFNSSNFSDRYH